MKRNCRLLLTDVGRSVFSWKFWVSAAGIPVIMLMMIGGEAWPPQTYTSVWYLMELSIQGSGINSMALCTLPVFAFGLSYASEWEQKAQRFWLIRTGVDGYAASKVLVSFVTGFLTVFVGIGIFILVLLPFFPVHNSSNVYGAYAVLVAGGRELEGLLLYMTHHGLTGALTAVCAMWFSTLLPNRFAAASAPTVLYFTLLRVAEGLELPRCLAPIYWNSGVYYCESAGSTLLVKFVTCAVLCAILGSFAKVNIDRRMRCD